ncbi:LLM class F420-dependent oxidoreductase [Ktedonobacter sp. SOSP1-85]|uniref:LLM class flavin-dependent oxidoreductase n=1 Tax=Ktedonobacter sp. SOSP1-85 TaxID=2778367 RepID=UPI0019150AA3|nr:LLM class flavin-dependent oxidoreductase [Ktedonobacter sp. SOSP1-85]GHO81426.1 LLM class F420-dependent oxidoreductase [Ktedonobacter sp. SOSP1-85]
MSTQEKTTRERVGLAVLGATASEAIAAIVAAEKAGVRQVWMTQGGLSPDTLTIFAAAAVQTQSIRMGTSIVPTYPRHPLALAQQALALSDIAPERLRLGVGPSHRPIIEGGYGIPMHSPQEHLREYVTILRAALWDGKVEHQGRFFTVKGTLPRAPHTPILISALREGAFRLAGELTDGALSWVCPVPYLLEKALPALRAGAAKAGRPVPPLVAHIPVALSQERQAVNAAARKQLGYYGHLPFYVSMFAEAGFPVSPEGELSDALLENMVVTGNDAAITEHLKKLLASGLDELLVMPIVVANAKEERERLARLIGQI